MYTVLNVLRSSLSIRPLLPIWMTLWHSLRLQLLTSSVHRIRRCIMVILAICSAATLFYATCRMDSRRDTLRSRIRATILQLPGRNQSPDMCSAHVILGRKWGTFVKVVRVFLALNASLTIQAQAITSLHFWWPRKRSARILNKYTDNLRFILRRLEVRQAVSNQLKRGSV